MCCCSMLLQCVALWCSVLRCVAVGCSLLHRVAMRTVPTLYCSVLLQCVVAVCCVVLRCVQVLQWVAVCCIVLQGVKGPHYIAVCYCSVLWCAAVYGSVLHRVAIRKGPTLRCSVLQCVVVCCSVLHRVAMRKGPTLCCSVLLQCTPEPHLKHNDLNLPRAYTSNLPRAYKFNLPRAYTFNVPHSHRVPLMAVGTPEPHSIYPIYHTHRILNLPHTPLNVCRSSLSALPSPTHMVLMRFDKVHLQGRS